METQAGDYLAPKNTFGLDPDDPYGQDDILIRGGEVHLPINNKVVFQLRSKDVLHDFYVPQFRAKMDLVPGQQSNLWFEPTVLGTYEVACAEYCGTGHYAMRGVVVVDTEEDFKTWLAGQPTFAETMNEGANGEQIVQTLGCVACHSIDGSDGIGPTWKTHMAPIGLLLQEKRWLLMMITSKHRLLIRCHKLQKDTLL